MFAEFVTIETVDALRVDHKPFVHLVTRRDDGTVIVSWVSDGIAFILDGLLHKGLVFLRVSRGNTAEGHVCQAVAVHVAIGIVGSIVLDIVIALDGMMIEGPDACVVVPSSEEEHCRRRDGPVVVSVEDIVADGVGAVATTFRRGDHLGQNALFRAEGFQRVGPSQCVIVVGRDDEVFTTCFVIVADGVDKVVVVCRGKHVIINDEVFQDVHPVGVEVAAFPELSVAAFKTDVNVDVVYHLQRLSHGVIAERRHAEQDHVEASYLRRGGKHDVFCREIGISTENIGIPSQLDRAFGKVGPRRHCR